MKPNLPFSELSDLNISKLKPWPNRARKHDRGKSEKLSKILLATGYLDPIIVDEDNIILSGHLRFDVYKSGGFTIIPGLIVTGLSRSQKQACVIGANRFPERGHWDTELLKLEFSEMIFDNEIDLDSTGFELGEIDIVLGHNETDDEEIFTDDFKGDPVSKPGDLWKLGDHSLFCGDCREEVNWVELMGGQLAQACITDPPYNLQIKKIVSTKQHDEFAMASGEMTSEEFARFLTQTSALTAKFSLPGALHFTFIDGKHIEEMLASTSKVYSERIALIVWAKTNAGMGSLYRSQHELIFINKVGNAPHINNVKLGKFGRYRTNVWTYPGANTFRRGRNQDLEDHPTVKPVEMIADAILDVTNIGDVVVDGFGGSGTLLVAAERTGRKARVMEIEPGYVDVSIRRWQAKSGKNATLASTGETYKQVSDRRTLKLLPPPMKEVL